jgi:hypothetical protein
MLGRKGEICRGIYSRQMYVGDNRMGSLDNLFQCIVSAVSALLLAA